MYICVCVFWVCFFIDIWLFNPNWLSLRIWQYVFGFDILNYLVFCCSSLQSNTNCKLICTICNSCIFVSFDIFNILFSFLLDNNNFHLLFKFLLEGWKGMRSKNPIKEQERPKVNKRLGKLMACLRSIIKKFKKYMHVIFLFSKFSVLGVYTVLGPLSFSCLIDTF